MDGMKMESGLRRAFISSIASTFKLVDEMVQYICELNLQRAAGTVLVHSASNHVITAMESACAICSVEIGRSQWYAPYIWIVKLEWAMDLAEWIWRKGYEGTGWIISHRYSLTL